MINFKFMLQKGQIIVEVGLGGLVGVPADWHGPGVGIVELNVDAGVDDDEGAVVAEVEIS